MDLPVSDPGPMKESCPMFHCDYADKELVHKIAQLLVPGLATACVDNTTGLFRGPSSVAVDIRKEMVDYLTQRSEMFVAETVVQGDGSTEQVEEIPDDPTEIISIFIDDFASSKRNWLSRLSGWLMSESREDKIDDFVQEMEKNAFWFMDRREVVAGTLLKNVDFKNVSHCAMKFDAEQELVEHKTNCDFRPVSCKYEGCHTKFCGLHVDKHEDVCPYKVIPCEQKCSEKILRRDMDRHCITVCPMKLINCPFYQVGCQSTFPRSSIKEHCSESLHSHLLSLLQVIHKEEASTDQLNQRAELLEKSESRNELAEALDVRSLTLLVKELESKMEKLEKKEPVKELESKMEKLEKEDQVKELESKMEIIENEEPVKELESKMEILEKEEPVQELESKMEILEKEEPVKELESKMEKLEKEEPVKELESKMEKLEKEEPGKTTVELS